MELSLTEIRFIKGWNGLEAADSVYFEEYESPKGSAQCTMRTIWERSVLTLEQRCQSSMGHPVIPKVMNGKIGLANAGIVW
jgi:hypothetical protein